MLDNAMLKDVASKKWFCRWPDARRWRISRARMRSPSAVPVLCLGRIGQACATARLPDESGVRQRICMLAARRRFGYRRLHFLLSREGCRMNQKRFRRLYREEGLQVRQRGGRKRALGTRAPMVVPSGANERWSLDFVSNSFTDGHRFRILAVVDDCAGMPGA